MNSPLIPLLEEHLAHYFQSHGAHLPESGLYDRIMQEVERVLLKQTLQATRGNQLQAAKVLGINRNTLRKKIQELQVTLDLAE